MSWIEEKIKRLRIKEETEGLDEEESMSLFEYEGRLESIEWEQEYLSGQAK